METNWIKVANARDIPMEGGACIKYKEAQIAIFNFTSRNEWYATQNLCPHRKEMILSRGMIGDKNGEPKVVCPFHKRNFSLIDGKCLSGDDFVIKTYPVKVEEGIVYVKVEG
jgi:nitrite reductase (NADH) small subunit